MKKQHDLYANSLVGDIKAFLTWRTEFCFSGAGKFCLAHGLRQLTRNVTSDDKILNFRSNSLMRCYEKHRMTFAEGRYATIAT